MARDFTPPVIDIKQYGGQQVAIVDGRVVASGRTLAEVLQKARELFPSRPLTDIAVFAVPITPHVIYYYGHEFLTTS